jgi:hypothetical protein
MWPLNAYFVDALTVFLADGIRMAFLGLYTVPYSVGWQAMPLANIEGNGYKVLHVGLSTSLVCGIGRHINEHISRVGRAANTNAAKS